MRWWNIIYVSRYALLVVWLSSFQMMGSSYAQIKAMRSIKRCSRQKTSSHDPEQWVSIRLTKRLERCLWKTGRGETLKALFNALLEICYQRCVFSSSLALSGLTVRSSWAQLFLVRRGRSLVSNRSQLQLAELKESHDKKFRTSFFCPLPPSFCLPIPFAKCAALSAELSTFLTYTQPTKTPVGAVLGSLLTS